MSDEIFRKLELIIKEVNSSVKYDTESHLQKDMGFDSLDTMSFFFEIEKTFGIKIPDSDISDNEMLSSINKIIKYIEQRINS